MKLSQMQDIAGCRAIMPTLGTVGRLVELYRISRTVHRFNGVKDYILEPKDTGYRGIHLKYSVGGDNPDNPYYGLKVELQIRTQLQHQWATAVEAAETFTGQALKSNMGQQAWLRFFALMSSIFALREGQPTVPGTPSNQEDLFNEIVELDRANHIEATFSGYQAILPKVERRRNSKYFVVRLDPVARRVSVRGFSGSESTEANRLYTALENEIPTDSPTRIVLVSASSISALRRAYPNYFLDTTTFLQEVVKIIRPDRQGALF
ncbi:hypothetical protein JOD78_001622 [Herbaspirillum sp. 1130]|nr:hypothetical protein [Herbaspirillum sp. 1130]